MITDFKEGVVRIGKEHLGKKYIKKGEGQRTIDKRDVANGFRLRTDKWGISEVIR